MHVCYNRVLLYLWWPIIKVIHFLSTLITIFLYKNMYIFQQKYQNKNQQLYADDALYDFNTIK